MIMAMCSLSMSLCVLLLNVGKAVIVLLTDTLPGSHH